MKCQDFEVLIPTEKGGALYAQPPPCLFQRPPTNQVKVREKAEDLISLPQVSSLRPFSKISSPATFCTCETRGLLSHVTDIISPFRVLTRIEHKTSTSDCRRAGGSEDYVMWDEDDI
jgi:hypothetical protein